MADKPLHEKVAIHEAAIATLSENLKSVTESVSSLAITVREQGQETLKEIAKLHTIVATASAPKQANWFAIMASGTSFVLLSITIGALVLSPMLRTETDLTHWKDEHSKLELHPVGKSRIDALEKSVLERAAINAAGIRELDTKLQKEYQLMDAGVRERVGAVERELRERWVIDAAGLAKIADKTETTLNRITVIETKLNALSGTKP